MDNNIKPEDMMLIPAFCKYFKNLTNEKQLRWAIHRRHTNGLLEADAVRKAGGRWIVITPNYVRWILSGEK